MREKMALEFNRIWYKHSGGDEWITMANKAVEIITEEIEKVENPFTAERFPLMELALRLECHSSFEVAHNKILALLK